MSIVAINAKQPEEIRVAVLASSKNKKREVSNLYIESIFKSASLKDIYAGVVRSITPGMGAAFVEYGPGRHGFLPFRDIAPEYRSSGDRQDSKGILKVGQPIIVQVTKEERDEKGAMLTTYISLPGTYLVLMPNRSAAGGVSKQLDMSLRRNMRQVSGQLGLPSSMSVILRTAGADRPLEDLKTDLELLLEQWEAIKKSFKERKAPFLIFQEVDILARTVRDYVRQDFTEMVVDDPEVFKKVEFYAKEIRPDILDKIRLYESNMPLFLHLDIEDEVESAFQRAVRLPSGGSIIFGRAEAGTSIDINSGSSTQHADIHETAVKTNLEAAEVIAKQLRLRDVGGLILIDFISMKEDSHRQQVEERLRESTQEDRARIQISDILPQFDVLVMSRQRLRPQLGKTNEDLCPTCAGSGVLRSIESLALSIIRTVEKRFFLKKTKQVRIEGSVELITYLSNENRASILQLEKDYQAKLTLLPNPYWDISKYKITGLNDEELKTEGVPQVSYNLITETPKEVVDRKHTKSVDPAIERFSNRISRTESQPKLGFVGKLFSKLATWGHKEEASASAQTTSSQGRRVNKSRRLTPQSPTNLRTKRAPRSLPFSVLNQEELPTSDNVEKVERNTGNKGGLSQASYDARPSRRPIKKQSNLSPSRVTLAAQSNITADFSALDDRPINTPLANPQPFKRSATNHYGGEPRVKHRGY